MLVSERSGMTQNVIVCCIRERFIVCATMCLFDLLKGNNNQTQCILVQSLKGVLLSLAYCTIDLFYCSLEDKLNAKLLA